MSPDLRQYKNCFDRVKCCICRIALPKDTQIFYHKSGARGQKQFCLTCGNKVLSGSEVLPSVPHTETETETADCPTCYGNPPSDWTCPVCGKTGPEVEKPSVTTPSGDLASLIAHAIQGHIKVAAPALDEKRVKELIAQHVQGPTPVTVEILDYKTDTVKDLGIQHAQFPALLRSVQARDHKGNMLNFWLVGAPGDGKTTACEMVARALGVNFVTVPTMSSSHIFFGYRAVGSGEYISSEARKIWENGGVLILDDFDATPADVAVELCAPLANGYCLFPDAMVPRHKDCVIMLTANTWGSGATADFVGRNKQDEAFLDRFVPIFWQIDEALESATCGDAKWAKRVQQVRANVKRAGIKVFVTPRASYKGAALLRAGLPQLDVERMVLRGRMSDAQWSSVC